MTTRRPRRPAALTIEDFRYPEQLGLTGPQLILGIRVKDSEFERPETQRVPRFAATGRKWYRLVMGARPWRYHATVLTPATAAVAAHISALCHEFSGIVATPGGGPYLSTVISYHEALSGRLLVGCNLTHRDLADGHYPVDLAGLRRLTSDALPEDPDDLLTFETGYERAAGCANRWSLVIVDGGGR